MRELKIPEEAKEKYKKLDRKQRQLSGRSGTKQKRS